MKKYQLAIEHHSQLDSWSDHEWLTLFLGQVWSEAHRFPRTQQQLDAIDYAEIQQGFERFKRGEFTVQSRGTTLEEAWIAETLLTRQFWMCLRNESEYWPPDKIPHSFKKNLPAVDIWNYVYYSFKYHSGQIANLSLMELKELPSPAGLLGVFLGNCAHAVTIVGILFDEERIVFQDPWQKGSLSSLLSTGKNMAGLRAVRVDKYSWSINRQEFVNSMLCFTTQKKSYDYYSSEIRNLINCGC